MLRDYERAWTAAEGLVTDRPGCVMRGADGTLVEVFEWSSAEAIERARRTPAVLALWSEFDAACDCVPLATPAEAGQMFGEFEPVAF